MKVSAEEQAR